MRVVLTRVDREAGHWTQALAARGHEVVALPLIDIAPVDDPAPARRAWHELASRDAAMFVSAHAVQQFRALSPGTAWPSGTRAWVTGPGTARALLAAGVPAAQIDTPAADAAQLDSEALWTQVAPQIRPGLRVLIVRGTDAQGRLAGRMWLAEQLRQAGVQVEMVAAYRRQLPAWTDGQRARAHAATTDGAIWLLSSSEAVGNLRRLVPDAAWSQARAIATHERIAQAAREAGFGVVWPSRPDLDAVVAALESIR